MDKIKNILQLFLSLRGDNFFIALIKKISIEKNTNPCKKDLRFFQRWNDEEKSSKILTVKTVIETHQQRERERERFDEYTSAEVKSYRPVRATCLEATFEAGNLKSPRGGRKSRSGVRQPVIIYIGLRTNTYLDGTYPFLSRRFNFHGINRPAGIPDASE